MNPKMGTSTNWKSEGLLGKNEMYITFNPLSKLGKPSPWFHFSFEFPLFCFYLFNIKNLSIRLIQTYIKKSGT